ncbi:hypothetical protein PtA15_10A21 [Puccinia triticina]|uniref:Uncharacterized protein n=1 Tax=Puccinia triticina TaxID=208348 RepID=A0ABY7D0V8_9BASI|nr:uncharacterized protein PtA15_10A21 [Puccinia triticina]WAQ88602.1 hypothetical protein PtA15_10A21 [Puccinia triticina]WAR58684.1 hypothetical protein PtB15_10B22 [Puccinia triticina]
MFNSSNTPSPKPKSRFFSNIRRSLRSNSQLTSVPESFFDPPKTLFSKAAESPSHAGTSSSYATSASSSNLSSPASNTPSRQLSPAQRRHASSFTKITFSSAEFLEDRYLYAQSPEKLCLSHELLSDESLPEDGLDRTRFFAARTTREAFVGKASMRTDENSPKAQSQPNLTRKQVYFAMFEDFKEPVDLLPEFVYEDPSSPTTSSKAGSSNAAGSRSENSSYFQNQFLQSSGAIDHDPIYSESYPSDMGLNDSPTLGYHSEFPSPSSYSSPPANNPEGVQNTRTRRTRIVDPGSLSIPCDFDYLSSILDTPPPIPQETFADSPVGMAY